MMKVLVFLAIINRLSTFEYNFNRPKFYENTSWSLNATTFQSFDPSREGPRNIFIDRNDTVYVPVPQKSEILVFRHTKTNHTEIINVLQLHDQATIFVTLNGNVYYQSTTDKHIYHRPKDLTSDILSTTKITHVCFGLFIDSNNTLYCSIHDTHQILATSLNATDTNIETIAGTGSANSSVYGLYFPHGIFVNTNFDVYVADSDNNRVQRFKRGQKSGTTVAGNGIPQNLTLRIPKDVILDGDDNLFIADYMNHQIIRVRSKEYQCIVGCTGTSGNSAYQLSHPHSMHFDSYGNIYVADFVNKRIQKFALISKSHETSITTESFITSTSSTKDTKSNIFIPNYCPNQSTIGFGCNISNSPCDMFTPCRPNVTCINNNTSPYGYFCQCEEKHQRCKPNPCQNNGTCNETSNNHTSLCQCAPHWEGFYCERKVNYCLETTCQNNGVCRPILGGYICECLGDNYYSGKHCEKLSTKIFVYKFVSKSFGYIAIIALASVALFVLIMDILKYCFGIDPVEHERELIRRQKQKHKPIIQRFIYVNESTTA